MNLIEQPTKLHELSTTKLRASRPLHDYLCLLMEDGEGPTWNFDYQNFKHDPNPKILILGTWRHPNTGNNLVGGVNLNYLTPQQINNLSKVLPQIMSGANLYQRYHLGKRVLPDVFSSFYRTYNPRYINGVKQGVLYPKKGFLKSAQDFLKKAAGLLYKSKEQRKQDAQPKFGSDLTSMQDTLDQAVVQNQHPELEQPDTPQMQAARNAFLKYQKQKHTPQDVERQEDAEFLNAADDYHNQQLGVEPTPQVPTTSSPQQNAPQRSAPTQRRPQAVQPKDPLEITPDAPPEQQPLPPEELEESIWYYSPIHGHYICENLDKHMPDPSMKFQFGDCGIETYGIVKKALAEGFSDFIVVDGSVEVNGAIYPHTWMIVNGRIVDPTKSQFGNQDVRYATEEYYEEFTPRGYVKNWIDQYGDM